MRGWLINAGLLSLFLYSAIANYHRGDVAKIIAAGAALALLGHIVVGVCRGLLWLLRTLIVADLNEKLKKGN